MRLTITWLLVILIAAMLVGTALAECAAMAMPCCSQHRSTNCYEICATPTGNVSSAAAPQFAGEFQTIATVSSVVPVPQFPVAHVQLNFAPSAENLLRRIHLLLI
jgi:hypothetical protein